ncbi:unnamed protein product [Cyclocybe aegerita]|uniref:peptidyl-tRNA hydrolase n=1 Tax=Cyclocybe aegerita TaxID=1973307 RepID=A0A8S0XSC0_CYCAE|nr:unnamed protein product [Cyclocybe aegerita]
MKHTEREEWLPRGEDWWGPSGTIFKLSWWKETKCGRSKREWSHHSEDASLLVTTTVSRRPDAPPACLLPNLIKANLPLLLFLLRAPATRWVKIMSFGYAVLVAASLSLGFWAGRRSTYRTGSKPTAGPARLSRGSENSVKETDGDESDDNESSSEVADGDISSLSVGEADHCKMVLVVRTDLGMTSGKIAAQCSHAVLACYKTLQVKNPTLLRQWERAGQTKVALRCDSEDELLLMQAQAQSLNLCARSIQDAGRTQIAAGSRTVLGIAGPSRLVNQITGKLRLL